MNTNIHCFLSEVGHNNFYYPSRKKAIIQTDTPIEILPWLSSNKDLKAIKVKNKYIVFLTPEQNTGNINKDNYSVVWIHKEKLPLSSAG